MRILQLHVLLPLVSFLTSSAIASALPQNPHIHVPTIGERNAPRSTLDFQPSQSHRKRSVGIGSLVPGFPDERVTRLPAGWSGVFADISAIRPSLPVAKIFIHFFKIAAKIAANDRVPERIIHRLEYGILVFEMWNEDPKKMVSREVFEAASLWLLNATQNGWTGLFVARILDKSSLEWIRVRLVTPFDLAGKISNSPWDR